jgi:hypothetical protein
MPEGVPGGGRVEAAPSEHIARNPLVLGGIPGVQKVRLDRDCRKPQGKSQDNDGNRRPPPADSGGRSGGFRSAFFGDLRSPGYFTITTLCDAAKPGPAMRT